MPATPSAEFSQETSMRAILWQSTRALTACCFAALSAFPAQNLAAQTHVISSSALQKGHQLRCAAAAA